MFGDRKVVENNDYFIVTHRDIDFNFDKEMCINEEKVIKFFKVIDLLIEFECIFGQKLLCLNKNADDWCNDCEDSKKLTEYYYNTKKLIFYHYYDTYHEFEINRIFREIYLTKYTSDILIDLTTYHTLKYVDNTQLVLYTTLDNNFNSDDDFIITVDDYFACIKMLRENGIVIDIKCIRYYEKCNKINYKGEEILFDTIYIRPKIQHIIDDIVLNKSIIDK